MSAATGVTADRAPQTLVLTGEATPLPVLLADAWRRRRLLPMLARHDFTARYRSAYLGLAWTVVLPLLQGAALAIVFTHVVRVRTSVSYPLFVLVGMTTWSYVQSSLSTGSSSIVEFGGVAGRVYFPRLYVAAVPALANFVGFAISMAVSLLVGALLGVPYGPTLLLLPVAMLLAAALVVVAAQLFSLLHVYFRDMRYIVTATLMLLFYATPVIYPLSLAGPLRPFVTANPWTGVLQLARYCVFGRVDGGLWPALGVTGLWGAVLLLLVLVAYRRHDRIACDRL